MEDDHEVPFTPPQEWEAILNRVWKYYECMGAALEWMQTENHLLCGYSANQLVTDGHYEKLEEALDYILGTT